MSIHLAHVGMCLEAADFIARYPPSYVGGGHAVAWIGFIVIGPTCQLYTFIFDYHVVHDNTCVHYISNAVDMPQTCWTPYYRQSILEHTKCPLHNLARGLLPFRKVELSFISCASDRLYKDGPLRVYPIRQIVANIVLVVVGDETDGRTNTQATTGGR